MTCDILATKRGPSCTKMSHLPNLKIVHVRFVKKQSFSFAPSGNFKSLSCLPPGLGVGKSSSAHGSTMSSNQPPLMPPKSSVRVYPKSIGVASMLQLGKLIKKTEKPKETMELSDFNLDSMTWSTPIKIDIYVEEHPFAKGAFRAAYKARMSKDKVYVLKKYLLSTYDELEKVAETPEKHARKSVQMHMLANNFAQQLNSVLS